MENRSNLRRAEDLDADPEEFDTEPAEEDYTISDARDGGYGVARNGHGYLGTFDSREDAEDAVREDAGKSYRPAVWWISDHGNAHLIEDFAWNTTI